jgi:hypothetical protein
MANTIKTKPNKETIGAKVILRKLKTSGLNSTSVVEPVIKKKPVTIIRKLTAINIKLILPKVNACVDFICLQLIYSPPFVPKEDSGFVIFRVIFFKLLCTTM